MSKTYAIRVTQNLSGYYEGLIEVEAKSPEAALKKLKHMSKQQIDDQADWTHGDEYDGDKNSIEIDESSINET